MKRARRVLVRVRACCGLALLMAGVSAPGQAHAQACALDPVREGVVARVIDAETLVLEDGDTVRLIGALAPSAPTWWKGEAPWRAEARTRDMLEGLLTGKAVRLAPEESRRDRHGRLLAQLFLAQGEGEPWVQGRLIDAGLARSYSVPDGSACARALHRREAAARERRVGLWSDPFYRVFAAGETGEIIKRRYNYAIVEGRVVSVTVSRKWTFVNFGADYRSDFTLAVAARDRRGFAPDIALEQLEGKRIRVRGWIERWNGPVIKANHPEQIEMLERAEGDAQASAERAASAPE